MNLEPLEYHGRVEYYSRKYFEKKDLTLKKIRMEIFNFLCKVTTDISCKF